MTKLLSALIAIIIMTVPVMASETITIEDEPVPMAVPSVNSSFKAYMDYRTITDTSSVQYQMQQEATTDEYGFRRYEDMYMVALGTYYSDQCGDIFTITFGDDVTITCIIGDVKDDRHTNWSHQYTPITFEQWVDGEVVLSYGGNVVEFIVDTDALDRMCRVMGDMSHSGLYGDVTHIAKHL